MLFTHNLHNSLVSPFSLNFSAKYSSTHNKFYFQLDDDAYFEQIKLDVAAKEKLKLQSEPKPVQKPIAQVEPQSEDIIYKQTELTEDTKGAHQKIISFLAEMSAK